MTVNYSKDKLQEAVKNSNSIREVIRFLGGNPGSGGVFQHVKKKMGEYNIDYSHFSGQGWSLGRPSGRRKSPDEVLVLRADLGYRLKADRLRKALLESGVEYKCSICNLYNMWQGKKITLEIDHINGNWKDNRKENLRFLCPNCHSQI